MMHIDMVTIDCDEPRKLAEFWTAVLDTSIETDFDGDYVVLAASREGGVRLGLQRVPEPRTGKNRVHLDTMVPDRAAEVSRLVDLGARVLDEHGYPGFAWTVLADPEGNEFCVGAQE